MTPVVEMRCRYNIEIPMRDQVVLRGDLYAPWEGTPCPVLLIRTVFRKQWMSRAFGQYDPAFFVRHGYAVFIQDARGLGESDGEFDRFTADGKDGYDTVEWLAAQPWCDGCVGMMGNYYAGYLQLMAAAENPPHLRAICPMQTSVSINRDCDNRGFLFASHIGWCTSRMINRLTDGRYDAETTGKYLPMLQKALRDYTREQLTVMPLCDMPLLRDAPFPIYRDYFRHLVDGYDDFSLLEKEGRNMDVGRIRTPAFYVGGWLDSARTPMLDHCLSQRRAGVDSRLLIVPWQPGEAPAPADSALENGAHAVDLQREMLVWFDDKLKGVPAGVAPVRFGDIASDYVYRGEGWPNADGDCLRLYPDGCGGLGQAPPASAVAMAYDHDPLRPLPYQPYGPCPPEEVDGRRALSVSAPLPSAVRVRGLVRAALTLSCDAPDADTMLTLYDVAPDGRRFAVCDGATRARYRRDWTSRPLTPGEVYPVDVLMGHVVYTFLPGHRFCLAAYGSAFPKYDVNHCTARRPARDAQCRAAHVEIRCGADCPSCLTLPVDTRIAE